MDRTKYATLVDYKDAPMGFATSEDEHGYWTYNQGNHWLEKNCMMHQYLFVSAVFGGAMT